MLRVLDLFSGIGGFSLGLERAGFKTVAFCEIDPYCRRVLAKHWPGVPIYGDIRELNAGRLRADGVGVDVICGGFPCQDISLAGKGAGIDGERSGLWSEYSRLIGELRPRYAIVENVAALLGRGLDRVLGDLSALGYDAEWHCIPAAAVGAPHRRDRLWIVAYAQCAERGAFSDPLQGVAGQDALPQWQEGSGGAGGGRQDVAHANNQGLEGWFGAVVQECAGERLAGAGGSLGDPLGMRELQSQGGEQEERGWAGNAGWWGTEPDVGRVAHGVPSRLDRLRALGNAVVPQIPELIGRAILAGRHDHGDRRDAGQAG